MRTRWDVVWLLVAFLAVFSLGGCDSGSGEHDDAGYDGANFDAVDAGTDAGSDPGGDPGADPGADQEVDAGDPDPGDSSTGCDEFTQEQFRAPDTRWPSLCDRARLICQVVV